MGTDDIYDLTPAPGTISEEGTLINKSTLLQDATAALYGLGSDAVPDDVLTLLSRFHGGLGNEYVWAKSDDTGIVGYVNSPAPSAYPPAEPDGYTYTALGRLGAKVQIATGSYVGTGTYGESNPNSLTFEFEPKLVIIEGDNHGQTYSGYFISGSGVGMCNSIGRNFSVFLTWNNDSVSWVCNPDTKSSEYQLNISGATYFYLAIG